MPTSIGAFQQYLTNLFSNDVTIKDVGANRILVQGGKYHRPIGVKFVQEVISELQGALDASDNKAQKRIEEGTCKIVKAALAKYDPKDQTREIFVIDIDTRALD